MATTSVLRAECGDSSYARALERFAQPEIVARYPQSYGATRRGRREERALCRALDCVPSGSSILDLPCGSGRLTSLLIERGLRVTAADSSAAMIAAARRLWDQPAHGATVGSLVQFEVRDVMQTGYADYAFDAVICNRLFHHFTEPDTRRRALTELRRICTGALIVSFFNSFAVDAWRLRWKHWRRGTELADRVPISLRVFETDIQAAGLRIIHSVPVLWGFSPQWYLVLARANGD